MKKNKKEIALKKRHKRIRKKIIGTGIIPRLSVHRSHLNLYVQLVDDVKGKTIFSASTKNEKFRKKSSKGGNIEAAKLLGRVLAGEIKSKGIDKAVFDRGGYIYHGRIKALAESLKANGLKC
ncbi:MAG: 50S ribosomal protein L18 [Candidatus Omnitrophota bacterium]|nr:50S ribosomal protein L18 [Candidatus Omnitrophota bacterium]